MMEIWMAEVVLRLEKLEDATLLPLELEGEAASWGMQVAPRSWKRQRNIVWKEHTTADAWIYSLRPILDLGPPEL